MQAARIALFLIMTGVELAATVTDALIMVRAHLIALTLAPQPVALAVRRALPEEAFTSMRHQFQDRALSFLRVHQVDQGPRVRRLKHHLHIHTLATLQGTRLLGITTHTQLRTPREAEEVEAVVLAVPYT